MPTEKEKWLKFDDGHYQFMLPFMSYADLAVQGQDLSR